VEAASQLAPPVVAVMVVFNPGEWFDEVLDGLADQDYANLKSLFLIVGEPGDVPDRVRQRVPNAFVRAVGNVAGYGAVANEVLRLVEGENGFFCFLHDDVALDPGAIRLLVEELYRSNAGIVGPKLVSWDDDGVLQHVGLGVDRFGEIDSFVEEGEVDQEQHDAVRDVFALPSACMMIRADLFRASAGFDPAIDFYGDDVDLCWRAHLGGARVVVVPAARARHREQLNERRPDLRPTLLQARHRMRSIATLTGARRLPLLMLQLLFVTIAELVVGVLSGKPREAWASLRAMLGLIPRIPGIIVRRREIRALRQVPDGEIAGLQLRGSARVSAYMRSRDMRPSRGENSIERRWRQTAGSAPMFAWICVLIAAAFGSRHLLGGIPGFGEFLRLPVSPRAMLTDYRSGWWGHGLGSTTPVPTGVALTALASTFTLFHMGLLHTVGVLGLLLVGYLGIWRLASLFPTARARIAALVVYAAVPLPSQLLSSGRWGALACYATVPWVVHLLRRSAGIESFDSTRADSDRADGYVPIPARSRLRMVCQLALLTAITFAFVPSFALLVVALGIVLAVSSLIAGGSWRSAFIMVSIAVAASLLGFLANLPWASSLFGRNGWDLIAGVPSPVADGLPAGSLGIRGLGVTRLARFGLGNGQFGILAIALYLPVLVAPLVARSWRFTWAVRSAGLVVAFGWLAVLDDRGLKVRLPEPGVLLAPVAVGLALSAACIAAAFQDDVLAGSFGWRQPLGLLSAAAVAIGVLPGLTAVSSGRWHTPTLTLTSVLGQFPHDPPEGDYRILWIGNPRVMPVPAWTLEPGIGYAITDDGPLTQYEAWPGRPSEAEAEVGSIVGQLAAESTLRGGRLLAPYAIRYIVVPVADGATSTVDKPLPLPNGLVDALDDQLDFAAPLTRPLNFLVYENTAWIPTRSQFADADATRQAGLDSLARLELRLQATPVAVGSSDNGDAQFTAQPGAVTLATGVDQRWSLQVGGQSITARPAFGVTAGYDISAGGPATLRYKTDASRSFALIGQLLLWLMLALGVSRFDTSSIRRWRRRHIDAGPQGPLLSIDAPVGGFLAEPVDSTVVLSMDDEVVPTHDVPHEAAVE
jgi:GT2 family glycosyltransferase